MTMLVAQLVGFIGVAFLLVTFQVNSRKWILRLQMISALIYVLHFFLLGTMTAAAMNLIAAGRSYLFERFRGNVLLWGMLVVVGIMTVVTWQDWTSLLPGIGFTVGTIAIWQKNPRHIRFLSLIVPPFWFTYNFIHGSYPGMTGDTVAFCSILVGIYRFDIRDRRAVAATSQAGV